MYQYAVFKCFTFAVLVLGFIKCFVVAAGQPKIKEFKFPGNLSPGDTVAVSCVVGKGSSGPLDLTWRKNGLPVQRTARLTVASHEGGPLSTLSIVHINAEDSGDYTCVARNAVGSDEYSAHLAVIGPSLLREFPLHSEVFFGEEIILVCVVKKGSTSTLPIKWLKDGEELRQISGCTAYSTVL